ncbi:NADH dehydrogenase subunit H [Gillisia sp. Hel_I_86]|uniref:complex I subunit 1/NuoH family protein n=1 Tax=Gillisia sp. Hel_I_86 TaxID=1249981 RepID=UPI00119B346F|nr:NADH-quinone oxidoreductase subunit H [Gillisia sp. Hel_I_86]TVZ28630.1 NADH dehydrogenase subunit H [Gillisia sp. Hel_I_86]
MIWTITTLITLASLYGIAVLERWSVYHNWDFTYPFKAFSGMFVQEDIIPRKHDPTFFETAPILFIGAAFLTIGVLPFAAGTVLAGIATGALFVNAALAYIMIALLMAGWAPNGVYAMVGGWRFLGQLIAYAMPIVMTISATVMRAESMDMLKIVESQTGLWNIIYQPLGFILFYAASMALAFLPPFDLPQGGGELAGGVFAEYTGKRLLLFRLGRLVLIFSLSLAITNFYLGGWHGPLLPGIIWTFLKTILVAASLFWAGGFMPRLRHDHTLEWGWKYATPAALLNILWVGVLLLL